MTNQPQRQPIHPSPIPISITIQIQPNQPCQRDNHNGFELGGFASVVCYGHRSTSYISFRHPGYSGPGNVLCRLPSSDCSISRILETMDDVPQSGVCTTERLCKRACNMDGFLSPTLLEADAVPDSDRQWD